MAAPNILVVRAAIEQGFEVVSLPGPSALTTALPVSGLPVDRFLFLGFLPRKAGERRRLLDEVSTQAVTLIFFEAPHRLRDSLSDMVDILGGERSVAVCRELTKLHEEIWRGALREALQEWTERDPRGEFTLVVAGVEAPAAWAKSQVEIALHEALGAGVTPKEAVRQVTQQSGWSKRDVYSLVQVIKRN